MSANPLCLRTFGEIIRPRMSKKMCKKEYVPESKLFESDRAVANRTTINGSAIGKFYSEILLESVLYLPRSIGETGLPDITPSISSQLKNGQVEVPEKIVEIAQRKNAASLAGGYFAANLTAHIPKTVLSVVIDAVDVLVQGDSSLGKEKQKVLGSSKKTKTAADYLAEVLVVAICNGNNTVVANGALQPGPSPEMIALQKAEELLATIPSPPSISPPTKIAEYELKYIFALFAAYGDAASVVGFNEDLLESYPDYAEDLQDRRIDYFAAESVRRGVSELRGNMYQGQFEILKSETFDGVKDTARKNHPNGYERMLAVMEQATAITVSGYLLCSSHNWISSKIKKGVCHFLVTDGKLKWVK